MLRHVKYPCQGCAAQHDRFQLILWWSGQILKTILFLELQDLKLSEVCLIFLSRLCRLSCR